MISPTEHYATLKESVRKAGLLTRQIDVLECKTELQHLKLQAYILMCHAAIEEYIENLGLAVAHEARSKFAAQGIITHALVALISSKLVVDLPEKSRKKITSELATSIEQFSLEAFNRYRSVVSSNNGIVVADQRRIFLPIGVDPETIDIVLVNAMHGFGAKRGDVAHKFKVQRTDTLSAVAGDLRSIVDGLVSFDAAACLKVEAAVLV